jgi:thiamine kinase-like enzyme
MSPDFGRRVWGTAVSTGAVGYCILESNIERGARLDGVYAALARVPLLAGVRRKAIKLERLGSLTNASYKIITNGEAYVLRLPGKDTSDYIDRDAEEHNTRIMAAAGVSAEVLYFDTKDGTMLSRFIDGVPTNAKAFIPNPVAPARAALVLRRVHSFGRVFRSRFNVFSTIDKYLGILSKLGMPLEVYYEVEQEVAEVRRALEASPVPLAPCHNDPWPGNFVDTGRDLYLVDWEFSGMNDPMWDLGDLSVEAGFKPEQDRMMMKAYYDSNVPPALYSRLALYKVMSDLLWALWGFIQHANDNKADDFLAYTLRRLERCKTQLGSADFGRHLANLQACNRSLAQRACSQAHPKPKASLSTHYGKHR